MNMSPRDNKKDTLYINNVLASKSPTNLEKELCDIAKYYIEQFEERSKIGHQIFLEWVEEKRLAQDSKN